MCRRMSVAKSFWSPSNNSCGPRMDGACDDPYAPPGYPYDRLKRPDKWNGHALITQRSLETHARFFRWEP